MQRESESEDNISWNEIGEVLDSEMSTVEDIRADLARNDKGNSCQTINNCMLVFHRDPLLKGSIRKNELSGKIDIVGNLGWQRTSSSLTDTDVYQIHWYLEKNYGLKNDRNINKAMNIVASENRYHPIRDYLEKLKWDGQPRIDNLLPRYLGADCDDYTKEKLIDRILDFNKDKYNTSPYGRLGFDIKPYCQQYEQRRLTGLQRLFLHYQYKLKILPRNNRCKLSPFEKEELQKAVQKMEEFNQQTIILCKNKIETFDDLYSHMDKIENELNHLIKERQKARNQVRKYKTKEQKDEQKLIAKSYTPEIGKLRKELMYCQKIEERSLGINKFLNEHEKQKRRKERTR